MANWTHLAKVFRSAGGHELDVVDGKTSVTSVVEHGAWTCQSQEERHQGSDVVALAVAR